MTAPNQYFPGNVIRLQASFYNTSSALADPTAVALTVEDANGTETSYSPTTSTTGVYYYDLTLPSSAAHGTWYYYYSGTGAIVAASESRFIVKASNICDN